MGLQSLLQAVRHADVHEVARLLAEDGRLARLVDGTSGVSALQVSHSSVGFCFSEGRWDRDGICFLLAAASVQAALFEACLCSIFIISSLGSGQMGMWHASVQVAAGVGNAACVHLLLDHGALQLVNTGSRGSSMTPLVCCGAGAVQGQGGGGRCCMLV